MDDKNSLIVCNWKTREMFCDLPDSVFLLCENVMDDACIIIDEDDFVELLDKGRHTKGQRMFQYIFADGSEVLARKGLPPLTVEKEEQTHGELLKVKEIRDGTVDGNGD